MAAIARPSVTVEPSRLLQGFSAAGVEIERLLSETAWLDGTVITLFAEHRVGVLRERRGVEHLPCTFMADLGALLSAHVAKDSDLSEKAAGEIVKTLQKVTTFCIATLHPFDAFLA